MNPKFRLGQIVATPGALDALLHGGSDAAVFLRRHVTGDWGELDEEDRRENELSVAHGSSTLFVRPLKRDENLDHHGGRPRFYDATSAIGILIAI